MADYPISKIQYGSDGYPLRDAKAQAVLPELVNDGSKNLIELYDYSYYESDVGVYVDSDYLMNLVCRGTCLRDIYIPLRDIWIEAGTYALSGVPETTTSSTYFLSIEGLNGATGGGIDYGSGTSFTVGGGKYRIYLRVKQGIDMTGKIIKPMLCLLSEWDISHDYEPYSVANAPLSKNYIESVDSRAKNKLNLTLNEMMSLNSSGITWNNRACTINGITFTVNPDMSITADGTLSSDRALFWIFQYRKNIYGNLWLSGCPSGGGENTYQLIIEQASSPYSNIAADAGNGAIVRNNANSLTHAYIVIKASVSKLTFKPMICTKEDMYISNTYKPYGDTNYVFVSE